jgi:hypothetical protein
LKIANTQDYVRDEETNTTGQQQNYVARLELDGEVYPVFSIAGGAKYVDVMLVLNTCSLLAMLSPTAMSLARYSAWDSSFSRQPEMSKKQRAPHVTGSGCAKQFALCGRWPTRWGLLVMYICFPDYPVRSAGFGRIAASVLRG